MSIKVITKEECTGCGLCKNVCNFKCISFEKDDLSSTYPVIDQTKCISCQACSLICPSLNVNYNTFNKPRKVYVAWNRDDIIRHESASGGVASGFYQYALEQDWVVTGACFNEEHVLKMKLFDKDTFNKSCRNSKYVFCEVTDILSKVVEKLKSGISVLFVGLPCQTAAIKKYAEKEHCDERLITCDIICHGVAPIDYLLQHIDHVIGNHKDLEDIYFRNPKYGTGNFMFSLSRQGEVIYKKRVKSSDTYQNGYHSALIYRENCYSCKYARNERFTDITIGDFSGLGSKKAYFGEKSKISCVMINTTKGESFWNAVSYLFKYEERPIEEALEVEKQLQHPSVKTSARERFANSYRQCKDFDTAVQTAIPKQLRHGLIYETCHVFEIKQFLRRFKDWYNKHE